MSCHLIFRASVVFLAFLKFEKWHAYNEEEEESITGIDGQSCAVQLQQWPCRSHGIGPHK